MLFINIILVLYLLKSNIDFNVSYRIFGIDNVLYTYV